MTIEAEVSSFRKRAEQVPHTGKMLHTAEGYLKRASNSWERGMMEQCKLQKETREAACRLQGFDGEEHEGRVSLFALRAHPVASSQIAPVQ